MEERVLSEKTRMVNFVNRELDTQNTREVARRLMEIDAFMDDLKTAAAPLKLIIEQRKAKEFFPEDKTKVLYEEGKAKTELDLTGFYTDLVINQNRLIDFINSVSVTETSIKKAIKAGDAEVLIAKYKKTLNEVTAGTVSVKAMSKQDLKEAGLA